MVDSGGLLRNWQADARKFLDDKLGCSLILGNGASIAVSNAFHYKNLLLAARWDGLISDDLDKIFQHLDTQDFELVLNMLWHTSKINEALGIVDDRTASAYEDIRSALVQTVRKHHAPYQIAEPYLIRM